MLLCEYFFSVFVFNVAQALTASSETKSRKTKKPEATLPNPLLLIMEELLKLPEFSWEEIKKHTDAQSCWCVFHGLVYDLTKFLKLHPGGSHVILEVAGIRNETSSLKPSPRSRCLTAHSYVSADLT